MTTQQMTFMIPPYGTATLTLPGCLSPDAFVRLDVAISQVLGVQRQPPADPGDPDVSDPGAIEFDSWQVGQH